MVAEGAAEVEEVSYSRIEKYDEGLIHAGIMKDFVELYEHNPELTR